MKKTVCLFMCLVLLSMALVLGSGMTAQASSNETTYFLYAYDNAGGNSWGYLDCIGMIVNLVPTPGQDTQKWVITDYGSYCTIFCPYLGASGAYLSVELSSNYLYQPTLSGSVTEQAKWVFADGRYLYNKYYNMYLTYEPNALYLTDTIKTNWMRVPA